MDGFLCKILAEQPNFLLPTTMSFGRRNSRRAVTYTDADTDYLGELGAQILSLTDGGPELKYSRAYDWPVHEILDYLKANSFTIPGRSVPASRGAVTRNMVEIVSADGTTRTLLPSRYRIPLMWVAQVLNLFDCSNLLLEMLCSFYGLL